MTDKEKLQRLFEAALKDPTPEPGVGSSPKRAFPEPVLNAGKVPVRQAEAEVTNEEPVLPAPSITVPEPEPEKASPWWKLW